MKTKGTTSVKLDIEKMMTMSKPVFEHFSQVEPKPWDRKAVLLELIGELGSLAHHLQHWDGYKVPAPGRAQLADECSDVLFIILRLAKQDGIDLPEEIEINIRGTDRAAEVMLKLCTHFYCLLDSSHAWEETLHSMLRELMCLADLVGVDLARAHTFEMRIALQFFLASGDKWPKPQFLRHPLATIRLWKLLWKRRKCKG